MMYVEFIKKFFLADSRELVGVRLISPPEPKNVWFPLSRHDIRRVHKKFFLADSREMIAVRVISASWAQKRLIPTF